MQAGAGHGFLPPLLKGYLRIGGFIGDGAVVDHQFNTTDVCIIVKTDLIAERYTRHYDLQGERHEDCRHSQATRPRNSPTKLIPVCTAIAAR